MRSGANVSDEAAAFVGSIPEVYDRGLGPIIFTDYDEYTARLVAGYAPSRVLETGAGTGIVTRRLRDMLPATARLVATDLNLPMLDVARKKFRPDEQIEFQHADAQALPFTDASFDAVVCQFGVMFFPDKQKSYREAYRVLTSGGRYVFSVWDGDYNRHGRIADDVAAQFFPTDPPQFYRVPSGYNKIDPIKGSLSDAGFVELRIAVLTREKQVADLSAFAHAMVYGNPLIDMIHARGGVDPDQVAKTLGEAFAREFGNPARLPQRAILFEATKP